MLTIGLVDVDKSKYPNLSLMKLSAYHKQLGDKVILNPSPLEPLDRLYMARVFDDTYTKDDINAYNTKEVIKGGSGYSLKSFLTHEVEHIYPDYSLYNIEDTAYGFLSRGCPRGCPFCIVKDKEGQRSYKVSDLDEFWKGQKKIELLDPNLTACPDFDDLLQQLINSKAYVNFSQGLDIRLMTEHKANLINKCKWKRVHFAWDNPGDSFTLAQLDKYKKVLKGSRWNRVVYILTNYNSTIEEDLMRVNALRDIGGYDPYIMIYDKPNAPKDIRHLQRWVNNKFIFWSKNCPSFEDYLATRKVR